VLILSPTRKTWDGQSPEAALNCRRIKAERQNPLLFDSQGKICANEQLNCRSWTIGDGIQTTCRVTGNQPSFSRWDVMQNLENALQSLTAAPRNARPKRGVDGLEQTPLRLRGASRFLLFKARFVSQLVNLSQYITNIQDANVPCSISSKAVPVRFVESMKD
jgi:hypothetical protein